MSELSELFDRDPLKLTREDRSKIISKMREDRAKFMLGQKVPREKKTNPGKIDLGSLDLGI